MLTVHRPASNAKAQETFEVFYMASDDFNNHYAGPGWFWRASKGTVRGPFVSEQEAIDNALRW